MYNDIINLLNLETIKPIIEEINVTNSNNILQVLIKLKKQKYVCPFCGSDSTVIKQYVTKKLLHSIHTNKKCIINYQARRFCCKMCKQSFYENNPFAMKYSHISTFTESVILKSLLDHTKTFKSVATDYNLSITSVMNIFDLYVDAKRRKMPEVMCIDEIYTSKLSRTKYAAVLLDFETRKIIDICSSRKQNALQSYFSRIPKDERLNVVYICIDMWEPYKTLSEYLFPNALIAVDSFHEFGRLLKKWKENIKNSFIKVKNKRLSNGPIEGMNSKLKIIFKSGNWYSNFELLRNRAMYSLNKNETIRIDKPKKDKNI